MLCMFGKTKEAGNTFAFCMNFTGRLSAVFGCIIPPNLTFFFNHSDTFILMRRHISVTAASLVDSRFKFCSWTV